MAKAPVDRSGQWTSESSIRISAGTIIVLGAVVLLGWHLGITRVVQLHPAFAPMQYNTALCFLLSGLAALYVRSRAAGVLSAVVVTIGLVSLLEYLLGRSLGIDQLFMRAYIGAETSNAGRMAPQTATGFVIAGAALATLTFSPASPSTKIVVNILASILGGMGFAAAVGYCVGLEPAYRWESFNRIAPHTACGFIVLAFAILQDAWRLHAAEQSRGPPLLAMPAGVAALAVTLSLFQALLVWQVERVDDATARSVERAAAALDKRLRGYVQSFGALADEWSRLGGEPQSTWEADVARFLRDQQVFLAISRVDSDGSLDWIFPAEPYAGYVGFDYSMNARRAAWLAIARERGKAVLTEPLELKSGRPGILILAPMRRSPAESAVFVVAAALLEELFRPTAAAMADYRVAVFHSDERIYGSDPQNSERTVRSDEVRIDGSALRIEATPLPETVAAMRSPLPTVVLVSGLFASLLLAVSVHLAQASARRAAALSAANGQLAAMKEKLERLALFDELTGLGNRNLLLMELDKRLAVAQRESLFLPVLLIDLNGFKSVNDTLGHDGGDRVLQEFAARLVEELPLSSEAFRTGGDEFAVLTRPGTSLDEALMIARGVERVTLAPMSVGGVDRVIGASIGIAAYPRHGQERTRVLRAADVAMYKAKHCSTGIEIASDEAPTTVLRALRGPR